MLRILRACPFVLIVVCLLAAPAVAGEKVIAREGRGLLLDIDGVRVCLLAGSPEEIGYQHGVLLKDVVQTMCRKTMMIARTHDAVKEKDPFKGSIESAFKRTKPFTPKRYLAEMEGLAKGSGVPLGTVLVANVFPELFHCSGFALFGKATSGKPLLHGRILDYMTEFGFQELDVVFVVKPDGYNAFINIGYAGLVGSVTGMNEKQVSFGEMGGRGVGDWDGVPMTYLMRMGMEQADTLDEAVDIFRKARRTCQYYYVIADGKIPSAVGLACEPDRFDVIKPNQYHELLPHPLEDAVMLSAGDRYEKLAARVKDKYGQFTKPEMGQWLMTRPVAMKSCLHCALFRPKTLDVWYANAGDPKQSERYQACFQKYHRFNLGELLEKIPEATAKEKRPEGTRKVSVR